MKTATFEQESDFAPLATNGASAPGLFQRARAIWSQARAERQLRRDLADVDQHILLDIGVATDEIGRVHAAEAFTPRNWRS